MPSNSGAMVWEAALLLMAHFCHGLGEKNQAEALELACTPIFTSIHPLSASLVGEVGAGDFRRTQARMSTSQLELSQTTPKVTGADFGILKSLQVGFGGTRAGRRWGPASSSAQAQHLLGALCPSVSSHLLVPSLTL